jgi:hypothetical protein
MVARREIKNGVDFSVPRRRDIAPAGELAGLPARDSPKPDAFAVPPQGMTHIAKDREIRSVFFVLMNEVFIA